MVKILVVYGTAYGQTERIVRRIAQVLTDHGAAVTSVRGDRLPRNLTVTEYDAYLVAASVILGRHQRYVRRFVRRHAARLIAAPSAFVSVCGTASGSSSQERAGARRYAEDFFTATGWTPRLMATFAGAAAYTQYGFITRWLMQRIARRRGRSTDTSRDHEYTDWDAVDRFAHQLIALVGQAAPAVR